MLGVRPSIYQNGKWYILKWKVAYTGMERGICPNGKWHIPEWKVAYTRVAYPKYPKWISASTSPAWLMSDCPRGPRRAPPTGHDVAGQGLQLDLPDAHVRLAVRFRSGNVAPYACPVEKHARVGKFALRRAVRAYEAGHSPGAGPGRARRGRAYDWNWN
jgi:hypothetical protein